MGRLTKDKSIKIPNPLKIMAFLAGAIIIYFLGIGWVSLTLSFLGGTFSAMGVLVSGAFALFIAFLLIVFVIKFLPLAKYLVIGMMVGVIVLVGQTYVMYVLSAVGGLL